MKPEDTSIRIGPHDVRVIFKTSLDGDNAESIVSGLFFPDDPRIELKTNLRHSRMAEVMMHETLHAIWSNTQFTEEKDEERAVSVLACSLTQLARDNPEFIKFWLSYAISRPS
ncbi:MAG: hypothetical protein EBR82_21545 [Caulobacteraceae bacterium]|nr:hypothetical protein [Caulobacteraceae bacterium]